MSNPPTDIEEASEDSSPVATRRVWFPYAWTGLVLGGATFVQLGGGDQDTKNFSVIVAAALLLIGLSIWFIRSSPFSRRTRWSIGLAPWVLLGVFSSSVKLINNGDIGIVDWRWRWAAEPDEKLQLAESVTTIENWKATSSDYPRFLGNGYWAEVRGVSLQTDWEAHPPKELWRQEIGAGWSAFSIVGNYGITQEQRGANELVTCYDIRTGELVWSHADAVRFDPGGSGALGGIGPRATPTIHQQRVLTLGATGILNCLDVLTGKHLWSHQITGSNAPSKSRC